MNIPNIKALMQQKIADIQSRLPVKMNIGTNMQTDFSKVLDEASATIADSNSVSSSPELAAPIIDYELIFNSPSNNSSTMDTKYPLVSGSYESVYPRLSQTQIQELMPRINSAIEESSAKYELDPRLIRAVIKEESGFQPFALSTSGAMGLMQLMPGTASGLGVTDSYNIEQNIMGGTKYLYYQLKEFDNNLELALAAYNAGPNAVKKHIGIPPYQQTQNYVKKVLSSYEIYQAIGDR